MTTKEVAAKFQNNCNVRTVNYRERKIDYFVEDNTEQYDLYFLITVSAFNQQCDKEKLYKDFVSMKKYLYDEGFLDPLMKNTNPNKHWKTHFLVRHKMASTTKLDLSSEHRKYKSFLLAIGKTFIVIFLIYFLLKWLFFA